MATKTIKQPAQTARLKKLYNDKFAVELMKELKLKNVNEVPKIGEDCP